MAITFVLFAFAFAMGVWGERKRARRSSNMMDVAE